MQARILPMKKTAVAILLGIGLLFIGGYWIWYGYLPPETPHKVISSYLERPLPPDWKIKHYFYEWEHIIGNGTLEAVIEIPEKEIVHASNYLPKGKSFVAGVIQDSESCFTSSQLSPHLNKYLNATSEGIYSCKVSMASFSDTLITHNEKILTRSEVYILDKKNRHLLVFVMSL